MAAHIWRRAERLVQFRLPFLRQDMHVDFVRQLHWPARMLALPTSAPNCMRDSDLEKIAERGKGRTPTTPLMSNPHTA